MTGTRFWRDVAWGVGLAAISYTIVRQPMPRTVYVMVPCDRTRR